MIIFSSLNHQDFFFKLTNKQNIISSLNHRYHHHWLTRINFEKISHDHHHHHDYNDDDDDYKSIFLFTE